jgi:predicted glutamine amidotransferase
MCRWVGYYGGAIRPEELIYETEHSLIAQSQSSRFFENGVNGDGLGLAWYGGAATRPGLYRNHAPAWADRNFRELCSQVESPLFIAHIRAATGTPVQQTNCHPFRRGRWVFAHNGFINQFEKVHRELLLAVPSELFSTIDGTTDSELLFHLALGFGLEQAPLVALERMAGFVEHVCTRHGIPDPLQMTLGVSDGEQLYAVRYSSGPEPNTLFVSETVEAIRALYPKRERLAHLRADSRAVVSEPLVQLSGMWREVPPSTALIVRKDGLKLQPFSPRAPAQA